MRGLLSYTAVVAAMLASSPLAMVVAQTSFSTDTATATATATRTTTRSTTQTSSSSTGIATHSVRVGVNHDYNPDTIEANPGDLIEFTFYGQNHSVVKAEFGSPCIPYNMIYPDEDIFFSGPVLQLDGNKDPLPTWTLEVNSTDPVFFYCSAPDSCITYKMIGVINPNSTHNVSVQKEFVLNGTTTFQLSPGEPFPAEGRDPVPGEDDDSGSGGGNGDSGGGGGGSGLSGGAIAGIAIGGAAVVLIAVALVYFCGRKGGIEKGYRSSARVSQVPPPGMVEAHYVDDGRQQTHSYNPYDQHGDTGGGPKSPPPPSTYTNSTYGGPPGSGGIYAPDPYNRARSPNQHSEMGSPHNSYITPGHPSPGYPPPPFGSPQFNQEPISHPAELEAHTEPPRRELG